jgi:hypothetical protein
MSDRKITISLGDAKLIAAIIRRADDAELVLPFEEWRAADKFRTKIRRADLRTKPSTTQTSTAP